MPRKEGDFEHNDQIYIEFSKNEHLKVQEERCRIVQPKNELLKPEIANQIEFILKYSSLNCC